MRGKKSKKPTTRFTTMIDADINEAIRALAWYERVTQRHIIEEAFQVAYSMKSHRVKEAIQVYRKQKSD